MSLLPRSHTQFQLKSYWNQFFTRRSTPFEWYGNYADLCHIVHKYVKATSKMLVVGCGNSELSENMYDAGIVHITNIDISEVVIKKMGARNFEKRPRMVFTQMDMLSMTFSDGTFDCVLDKGTLDAIFSNKDDVTVTKVNRMWDEIGRVLKAGGRYMCITLAQEHILSAILDRFNSGWLFRAHKVVLSEGGGNGEGVRGGMGLTLPVIVFVLTKMLTLPGKPPMQVVEVMGDDGKCVRCDDVEGVRQFVKAAQQHAMLLHHLKTLHPGEPSVQVALWCDAASEEARYTFTVIDIHKSRAKNGPFAIFIVPQGREGEWIFSSDAGIRGLAEQSSYQRLVVVSMHRGHEYGDLQQVKKEVSDNALAMIQAGVPQNIKLPILSTGEGVGCLVCLCEGVSAVSGRWRVEECGGEGGGGEGGRVRRLVFLSTSHLVQTEMRLRPASSSQKKKKNSKKSSPASRPALIPDPSCLTFTYHRAALSALCLVPSVLGVRDRDGVRGQREGDGGRVLVIGLGGGALPTYIHRYLPQVSLEVCEVDPDLVNVAEKWFGFQPNASRVSVHIEDGVSLVRRKAATTVTERALFSAIIVDVDSKDLSSGMSSPPLTFVEPAFLTATETLLTEDGVLVTNVSARNESMKIHVLQALRQVYSTVVCLPLQEDLNDIAIGLKENTVSNGGESRKESVEGCQGRNVSSSIKSDCENEATESSVTNSLVTDETGLKGAAASQQYLCGDDGGRLNNEGVGRGVCDLVSVIGENGGDVEGLESELVGFLMSKSILAS